MGIVVHLSVGWLELLFRSTILGEKEYVPSRAIEKIKYRIEGPALSWRVVCCVVLCLCGFCEFTSEKDIMAVVNSN